MAAGPGGVEVGRVSIKVVPDTSKFRQELIQELKKATRGISVEIEVKVDTKSALAQLKVLEARLKSLDTRVNVSAGSGLGALSGNLKNVSSSATEAGSSLGGMSTRMVALGAAILLIAAPALGLIATLLAGLPSLIAAAGAGFAAVALGMDGIKAAAKTLQPEVENLKKSLSSTFEKGLTPVFEQLKGLFPVLDRGLNQVAGGIIAIAQSLTDLFTSAEGMKQIETILANMGKFFTDLAPVIKDFVGIFLDLTAIGSENFGTLVNMLGEFASGFREMIAGLDAEVFTKAFQGLADVLGATLRLFTDLFSMGLQFMGQLGGPLSTLINGINGLLQGLLPILSTISGIVANVLGEAFLHIGNILQALSPALTILADIIGGILLEAVRVVGPVLTTIAQVLNTVLVAAFQKLAPLIPPLVQFFGMFVKLIGETLILALEAISPLLMQLVDFVVQLFAAVQPLLPALFQLAQVIFAALLNIIIQLVPPLMEIANMVFPLLIGVIKDLVPIVAELFKVFAQVIPPLTELIGVILNIAMPIIRALGQVVADVFPAIQGIIEGALQVIMGIINFALGLISGDWEKAWEGAKQVLKGAWNMITGALDAAVDLVISFFKNLPSKIIGALGNVGSLLFEAGRNIIGGLIDGIKNMVGAVGKAIGDVASKIRNFLPFSPAKEGPLSGKGYTLYSGQALVQDWAKGITQATPDAVSAIDDAMAASQGALDMNAQVQSDGFVGLSDQISSALSGWEVVLDANGLARMVNKQNSNNARR